MSWQTITKENNLLTVEKLLSELSNNSRLEAEFYIAGGKKDGLLTGADVIDFVQYGTSNALNEDSEGYPVHRLNEYEMDFSGVPEKYCDLLSKDQFEKLRLKAGDVLICRTNGNPTYVGKAAMVMEDTDFAFASYLFRVRTNLKIKPSVLVSYLNSKSGRAEIEKYSIVSNQANFSPAKFRQISIPNFPQTFQESIGDDYLSAWKLYSKAKKIYQEAENRFLLEINLSGYEIGKSNISTRSFAQVAEHNRLDAEYWQPKYEEMSQKVSAIPQKELGEISSMKKGVEVGSEEYKEDGYPFIRVSDFSIYGIDEAEKKISEKLYRKLKEDFEPNAGEVLFTKDGTIGLTSVLDKDIEAILSSAFLRLKPKKEVNSQYLALVLNSIFCKAQIERMSGGAIIAHLKPESVKALNIPILSDEKQKEIGAEVAESFKLRREAKNLLERAKRAVEVFVEKDEKAALAVLER